MVGLQQMLSKQIHKKNTAKTFRNNAYDEGFDSGIFLDYKRNNIAISIGYMSGYTGYSYKVSTFNIKESNEGLTQKLSIGNNTKRIPLKLSYTLKKVSRIPFAMSRNGNKISIDLEKARAKQLYLINFKLVGFAAISYNWLLVENTWFPDTYEYTKTNPYTGDYISFNTKLTKIRNNNLSIMAGLTFQCMHKDKERLAVTIYYNQGLSTLKYLYLRYNINGEQYHTTLDIKGSVVGVNISYPFKLYDFDKRKRITNAY